MVADSIIYLMKYTKRFKGWLWKIIFLSVLVYIFKNYSQIKEWPLFKNLSQSQVLGEQTISSAQEKIADSFRKIGLAPIQEKLTEEYYDTVKDGTAEQNIDNGKDSQEKNEDYQQYLNEFLENIEKLPQKQTVKIKEYLIKEIFPECQCRCDYDN